MAQVNIITQVVQDSNAPPSPSQDKFSKYKKKLIKHKSTASLAQAEPNNLVIPDEPLPSITPPHEKQHQKNGFIAKTWNWFLCCFPDRNKNAKLLSSTTPHVAVIQSSPLQDSLKTTQSNNSEEVTPVVNPPGLKPSFFPSRSAISLPKPTPPPALLPPIIDSHKGRKCLVLDLDETLVHSSFKPVPDADFIIPVEIDGVVHKVYVLKRPHVDEFLAAVGQHYELVVFTASLSKYADPVMDCLDPLHTVTHRLFRESCVNHRGNYVKDLNQLGRDLNSVIIIDNAPASYLFHPNNAIPITSWFNEQKDTELRDLIQFLVELKDVEDVRCVLEGNGDESDDDI